MDNYGRNNLGQAKTNQSGKNYRNKPYFQNDSDNNVSDTFKSKNYGDDDYYNKKSSKKQDQNFYQSKPGSSYQQNRDYRQASEPRNQSNNFDKTTYMNNERSARDTRSVEANKPPTGRRNSNTKETAIHPNVRLPQNILQLPPRLQKAYLREQGLPPDYLDHIENTMAPQSNWSNTMPLGGRGNKGHRYDHHPPQGNRFNSNNSNNYHHKHQQNYYQNDYDNNYRSLTPPPRGRNDNYEKHQNYHRNEWKPSSTRFESKTPPLENNGVNSSPKITADSKFDWSEDVEKSQSMPHEVNNFSPKSNQNPESSGSRNRNRRRRNRSASSNGSIDRHYYQENPQPDQQDTFKAPYPKSGNQHQRRASQSSYNSRENSVERGYTNYNSSRDNSLDRRQNKRRDRFNNRTRGNGDHYTSSRENSSERYGNWNRGNDNGSSWRSGAEASTANVQKIVELTKQFENSVDLHKGGVLVLPQQSANQEPSVKPPKHEEHKTLFDPRNPERPIVVTQSNSRPRDTETRQDFDVQPNTYNEQQQYNNSTRPSWYNQDSTAYKSVHTKSLIDNLDQCDKALQLLMDSGELFEKWDSVNDIRERIQKLQEAFLVSEMKFVQEQNLEHFFWKLLFYNIIELMRKRMNETEDESESTDVKSRLLEVIDNGTKYMENLVNLLEKTYKFNLEEYTGSNAGSFTRGLGYLGLALITTQKIYLFLGDLARYREQIHSPKQNNFGKAKQYYVKAQQIIPRNGRPYNQLALLSVYSKRKIDAVYYYMRSLMSANPFLSARESMIALFDEIRKKYESSQRKREEKNRLRLKEKEHRFDGHLRKETWIHPEDGCRVHRTAPLDPFAGRNADSSEDEELQQLIPSELNKRFITSFLHIQGKLITKIGMESFQTCSIQMLREFRALLQHSPIAITSHRLLQLISLNMYAIYCSQLKDPAIASIARSEVQECAISIGLLMFGIILERFIQLLKESLSSNANKSTLNTSNLSLSGSSDASGKKRNNSSSDKNESTNKSTDSNIEPKKILTLTEDAKVMLPAIRVWCEWMSLHVSVWNPPPFCSDYKFGTTTNHDPWHGLANLMTLLEKVDLNRDILSTKHGKDTNLVKLSEDITLAGFTPLIKYTPEPVYCSCDIDLDFAQNSFRLQKVNYFGRVFLCDHCDPPILKNVTLPNGAVEYISVVQNRVDESDSEILLESFSDEESEETNKNESNSTDAANNQSPKINKEEPENCDSSNAESDVNLHQDAVEIRKLLRRKDELERKQKMREKYDERLQEILSQSTVALHIEVRPRYLIPDTNCFVDYIEEIKAIANAHPLYQLMIPIVVISELEGLSRGIKQAVVTSTLSQSVQLFSTNSNGKPTRLSSRNDPQHAAMVANASKNALSFLKSKNPAVKCVTTKGSILNSLAFTSEDDNSEQKSNDDKILDTAMNLCKKSVEEMRGDVRHLMREVVLLTTDRNLRVKALSNDLPVRELPDFVKWAGLGS